MDSTDISLSDYYKLLNSKRSNPDEIRVFHSMRIANPQNTLIQREPQDNSIRVLVIPEEGEQTLVIFNLPDTDCTVQDFLNRLNIGLKEEIHNTYLVKNPTHNVNYVVMVRKKSIYDITNKTNSLNNLILTYPLPPHKGKITVTADDFKCLNKGRYLNDIIIDFYLKYLTLEMLSSEDRQRIYVFSSFFYTRLTRLSRESKDNEDVVPIAEKQHAEVKRWTKDVNIFEKDFVVVPIHKNAHWFLAIICFPGLINSNSSKSRLQNESKHPCILSFDSMASVTFRRTAVINDLKNYLKYEFLAKIGSSSTFAEENIKVYFPDVPQQFNANDCGLYVLQYAENFFKEFVPVDSFELPLKRLSNWFDPDTIIKKREKLKYLLIQLDKDSKKRKINNV